jgi:hypothetical protein
MLRNLGLVLLAACVLAPAFARADVVTDWNETLNQVIIATPDKHNPGLSTRAMALLNGSVYDIFQAVSRTHQPFKVNMSAPGADINAAVATAAHIVLSNTFGEQQAMIDAARDLRLGLGPYSDAQLAGIALGTTIGQHYVNAHSGDSLVDPPYSPTNPPLPGHWQPDPLISPDQKGWGSDWGLVTPWAMPDPDHFDAVIAGPPALSSPEYVAAFDMVKSYGERTSMMRSEEQTEIGLFWAYDRPNLPLAAGVGPPPVLFIENLIDIADQVGNKPEDNARLFAMASISMADAAIASWDVKYEEDFWRPITAIRANSDLDGNPLTVEQDDWVYLGAPGADHAGDSDDFTPPFPAYTSGHATMGGAVFKAIELFYGSNNFNDADAAYTELGDLTTSDYDLHSNEFAPDGSAGMIRTFGKFTQDTPLSPGAEDSPEGENGMSRVYLGIHWIFDQQDGITLGNAIAEYAAGHYFQPVPEPSTVLFALIAAIACVSGRRRRSIA